MSATWGGSNSNRAWTPQGNKPFGGGGGAGVAPSPTEGDAQNKKKKREKNEPSKLSEFELEHLLGKGAFGLVYLARHVATGKYCALKQIDKTVVKRMGKDESAKTEKKILITAKSPYLLKAVSAFQDQHLAWLALEYCPGGDLKDMLEHIVRFEEKEALLFFAEMIMGVHDLHTMGYLHRDLKPANFLIDRCGHIKLADFGLSKNINQVGKQVPQKSEASIVPLTTAELERRKQEIWKKKTKNRCATVYISHQLFHTRRNRLSAKPIKLPVSIPQKNELRRELGHSIVGSPEYMSPEVTFGRAQGGSYYGPEVDWWSLGCVFFEMIFGNPPFAGDSPEELFKEIDTWSQKLPKLFEEHKEYVSPNCYSLLTGFLCDPVNRLGSDITVIKKHAFFSGIDWNNLLSMESPFPPETPPEMAFFTMDNVVKQKEV